MSTVSLDVEEQWFRSNGNSEYSQFRSFRNEEKSKSVRACDVDANSLVTRFFVVVPERFVL